jgi:hypothetical protein
MGLVDDATLASVRINQTYFHVLCYCEIIDCQLEVRQSIPGGSESRNQQTNANS